VSVELFGRKAQVIVAPIDGGDGIDVTGLRVVFKAQKTSTSEPNTATVEIYNLSEYSRIRIKAKDQAVIIRAGYQDSIETVCAGVIKRVEHRRDSVDTVTEIEIKDGGTDLLEPEFRRSYGRGTSKLQIVNNIISAMPNTSRGRVSASGLSGVTSGKLAFSTTAKLALDRVARAWNLEWSIQDGAVQVLDSDGTVDTVELATVVGPTSGLLGSPSKTGQEGPRRSGSRVRKQRPGAKFRCLLNPSIRPGRYVILQSDFVSGSFKAQSVEHSGDTHGDDWTTEVEAVQI